MQLPAQLLQRKPNSHKGNFGHIFFLAGSKTFSGAAILPCYAALRSGAGLVTLGIPKSISNAIIKIKPPEIITQALDETSEGTISDKAFLKVKQLMAGIDILVVGPGLSQNKSTMKLVRKIIGSINSTMVIDADGLNALVNNLGILKRNKAVKILTPHPGEMAGLINKPITYIQKNRKKVAIQFAKSYNTIVVLKGNKTVVSQADGKTYVNKTGNPGMATAGSGDVLTGIIASFVAQGLTAFEASKYGVYLHGLAGDLAAKEKTQMGMIASDIIEKIPAAIKLSSHK